MRWNGGERAPSDAIATMGIRKLLLFYFRGSRKRLAPWISVIGRPARGYSVSLVTSQTVSSAGPWVVGLEFDSHVHNENAFLRTVNFLMSRIPKILLDPQKLQPRVGDTLTRISSPFQGERL